MLRPSSKGCDWQENRDNSGFKFAFRTRLDTCVCMAPQRMPGRQNKLYGHASAHQVCMWVLERRSHPESNKKEIPKIRGQTQIAYRKTPVAGFGIWSLLALVRLLHLNRKNHPSPPTHPPSAPTLPPNSDSCQGYRARGSILSQLENLPISSSCEKCL
jgi:hypothetical protein